MSQVLKSLRSYPKEIAMPPSAIKVAILLFSLIPKLLILDSLMDLKPSLTRLENLQNKEAYWRLLTL